MNKYDKELEHVISNYQKLIYKLALDIVRCKEDAENIIQDTFLAYYKNIEKYIELDDVSKKRILARIAINKAKDNVKSKYVSLKDNSEDSEEKILLIKSDFLVEEALIKREKEEMVIRAINNLKEPYRSIINDYFINDMTLDSLAEKINTNKGTLKVQLTRGKQILKDELMKGGHLL